MHRLFDRLNLTPAERRLVVGILAVVFVVVNYWLVWPRFGDFRTVREDIEAMDRKRQTFQREIDRRPTYEATLRKLQSQGSVVPQGEERIAFRSDMERLVREVGLVVPRWGEVITERAANASSNAFFDTISLSLSQVAGSEGQFVDFLYRVGASNSTIRVKDLTLAPGAFDTRAQGKTNLVGTLKLVAAIQRAQPKPAPGASNAAPASPSAAKSPTPSAPATSPGAVPKPSGSAPARGATNPAAGQGSRSNTFSFPALNVTTPASAKTNPPPSGTPPKNNVAPPATVRTNPPSGTRRAGG